MNINLWFDIFNSFHKNCSRQLLCSDLFLRSYQRITININSMQTLNVLNDDILSESELRMEIIFGQQVDWQWKQQNKKNFSCSVEFFHCWRNFELMNFSLSTATTTWELRHRAASSHFRRFSHSSDVHEFMIRVVIINTIFSALSQCSKRYMDMQNCWGWVFVFTLHCKRNLKSEWIHTRGISLNFVLLNIFQRLWCVHRSLRGMWRKRFKCPKLRNTRMKIVQWISASGCIVQLLQQHFSDLLSMDNYKQVLHFPLVFARHWIQKFWRLISARLAWYSIFVYPFLIN